MPATLQYTRSRPRRRSLEALIQKGDKAIAGSLEDTTIPSLHNSSCSDGIAVEPPSSSLVSDISSSSSSSSSEESSSSLSSSDSIDVDESEDGGETEEDESDELDEDSSAGSESSVEVTIEIPAEGAPAPDLGHDTKALEQRLSHPFLPSDHEEILKPLNSAPGGDSNSIASRTEEKYFNPGQRQLGQGHLGQGHLAQSLSGADHDRVGSDRVGSDRVGPDRVGSDRLDTPSGSSHPPSSHPPASHISGSTDVRDRSQLPDGPSSDRQRRRPLQQQLYGNISLDELYDQLHSVLQEIDDLRHTIESSNSQAPVGQTTASQAAVVQVEAGPAPEDVRAAVTAVRARGEEALRLGESAVGRYVSRRLRLTPSLEQFAQQRGQSGALFDQLQQRALSTFPRVPGATPATTTFPTATFPEGAHHHCNRRLSKQTSFHLHRGALGAGPDSAARFDKTLAERTLPDRMLPDRTLPDRTLPDRTLPDRMSGEQQFLSCRNCSRNFSSPRNLEYHEKLCRAALSRDEDSSPPTFASSGGTKRLPCKHCGRAMTEKALAHHEKVCIKIFGGKARPQVPDHSTRSRS
ncbi:A C2HC-type zinc-finger protein [Gregarina niphandrodes]|uniref:A C2HC-type zinc-finger protein n=1 Tax=Gregarina niphandrodes TaxID=110365 RepID=A0A023B8N6_GRENI|nr:A C2HC-type zinc-finger protein [Gregarina niphandrodes]EZG69202.1 A C2HC-type zinc-finger protein [Gregarina niphandrodes]|eukprot:XP_011134462.1 A C2HC-type zinc-finger protein [Gregarina niphandrodes]